MIQITPVGVAAADPDTSISFYRKILGIPRVQNMGSLDGLPILRLESPDIEIDSTLIATFDRPKNRFYEHSQRLRLLCNLEKTLTALKQSGVEVSEENGRHRFIDINGLTWHLSDNQNRPPQLKN